MTGALATYRTIPQGLSQSERIQKKKGGKEKRIQPGGSRIELDYSVIAAPSRKEGSRIKGRGPIRSLGGRATRENKVVANLREKAAVQRITANQEEWELEGNCSENQGIKRMGKPRRK